MSSQTETSIIRLKIEYIRAERCWRSNNLKACLGICERLMGDLALLAKSSSDDTQKSLKQLNQLIWFLRLRCLSEDYFVNVSFLLDDTDIDSHDNKVRVFSAATRSRPKSGLYSSSKASDATRNTGISRGSKSIRSGTMTGRKSSAWSGSDTRVKSSYRPLTTGLTASQTAFSRSTRPLLKYSSCSFLSKFIYDYLYNAQVVTNQCPDYRQCLEFIKIVEKQKTLASTGSGTRTKVPPDAGREIFWVMSSGICHFNLRMDKEAEEHFRWVIAKKPLYLDGYTWLIKTSIRTNELSKILLTCETGIKNTRNSILSNWMSRVHSLMGNLYTANSCLRDSLRFDPMNIEALANVGYFSFYSGKLEQSLKCFQRIKELSLNHFESQSANRSSGESAELLNNLAVCSLYCGFYHQPIPLFNKAFSQSQSSETTSDIWYNLSFVQLECGFKQLAIGCLRLALKNNAQNYEALNNLGVLLYGDVINDHLAYENVHEHKGSVDRQAEVELDNKSDQKEIQAAYDGAESYFRVPDSDDASQYLEESLFNMALCKWRRGQLSESVKYCGLYMEHDPSNYHIQSILKDIQSVVAHDS